MPPTPPPGEQTGLPPSILADAGGTVSGHVLKQIDKLNDLMHVVVLVLIVMVATLLATVAGIVISAYQNQASAYERLSNQLDSLGGKVTQEKSFSSQSSLTIPTDGIVQYQTLPFTK